MWPCLDMWQQPPEKITLATNELHVWRFSTDTLTWQTGVCQESLSQQERDRAARFHFERDRQRYFVSHNILRSLLSYYTGLSPRQFWFNTGPYGKPILPDELGGKSLQFNLTHSHGMGLCAFANHAQLGVDIEWIRSLSDLQSLAQHFFSRCEIEQLEQVADELKTPAFYHCWTRKEAFIKAIGEGLSYPLAAFDVSLLPEAPAQLLNIRSQTDKATNWQIIGLRPGENYVGAVAIPGQNWNIRCWHLPA